ncbi:hypothetical protein TWF173_005588 [Orbilia oligospora]|nr:hypothetical protein TWF173_005588 [Orbilia oligospora]KAF3313754.1 hypothetical protein TWF173_005588 [Orbilia oligospora]
MSSRPSSPSRPRSPPRPRSPTTSTFQIRGLPSSNPSHEAGSVTISSSEYDELIQLHPETVLCYIDEDDEDVIRVGSGTELRSRWLEVMSFPPPPPPIIFNVEGGLPGLRYWQDIHQRSLPEPPKQPERQQSPPPPPLAAPAPAVTVVEYPVLRSTSISEESEEDLYSAPPKTTTPIVPPKETVAESSKPVLNISVPEPPPRIPLEFAEAPFIASFEAEVNRIYDEVVSQAGGSPRSLSPKPISPRPIPSLDLNTTTPTPAEASTTTTTSSSQPPVEDFPKTPVVELISDVFTSVIQGIQRVAQEATTQAARAFPQTPTADGRPSPAETLDAFNIAVQQLLKNFTDQLHILAAEAVTSASNPQANPQHPAAVLRTFAETVGHVAVQNAGRIREELRDVGSDAGAEARRAAEEIKKATQIVTQEVGRRGSAIGKGAIGATREVGKVFSDGAGIVTQEVGRRGSAIGKGAIGATREVGKVFSDSAGIVSGFAGGLVRNLSRPQAPTPPPPPPPRPTQSTSRPEDAPEVVEDTGSRGPADAKVTTQPESISEQSVPGSFPVSPHSLPFLSNPPGFQMPALPPPPPHSGGDMPPPLPPHGYMSSPPPPNVPGFHLPPPPGPPGPFPPPPIPGKHMPPPPHHGIPPMFHHGGCFPSPPPPPHHHYSPPPPPPLPIPYHPIDLHFHHPHAHPPSHSPSWQLPTTCSSGAWSGFGRNNEQNSARGGERAAPISGLQEAMAGLDIQAGPCFVEIQSSDGSSSDSERDYKTRKGVFRSRINGKSVDRSMYRRRRSQENGHTSDGSVGDKPWRRPRRRSPPKATASPFENPWVNTRPTNYSGAFAVPKDFKPVAPPKPFYGFPHEFPPPPPQFFPPLPSLPTGPPSPAPEVGNSLPPISTVVPGFGTGLRSTPDDLDRRHSSYIPLGTTSAVGESESEDEFQDSNEAPEVPASAHERVVLVDLASSVSSAGRSPIPEPQETVPQFHYPGLRRSRTTTDSFGKNQPWLSPWQQRRAADPADRERSEAMKRFPSLSELQREWSLPSTSSTPTPQSQPKPQPPTTSPFDDLSTLSAALPPIKANDKSPNPFAGPSSSAAPTTSLPGAWPFPSAPAAPLVDTSDVTPVQPRHNSRNPFLSQVDTSFTPRTNYDFPPLPGNLHRATSMSNASTRSRQSSTSTVRFAEPLLPRRAQTVLNPSGRNSRLTSFTTMPGGFPEENPAPPPRPPQLVEQTSQTAIDDALARERERMRLIDEVEETVRRSSEELEEQQRINAANNQFATGWTVATDDNTRAVPFNEDPVEKCVQSLIELGYTELGTDRLRVFSELSGGVVETAVEMVEEERGIWQSFTAS